MALPKVIKEFVANKRVTLLGVGPMSPNCVDAAVELANDHEVPLLLIASRRQVDCAELGGGYVNKWTTPQFADYVRARDKKGMAVLARDHGGPWQNPTEAGLPLDQAMESAKYSFSVDIDSGFSFLHIDTSVNNHGQVLAEDMLERVFELYKYCHAKAAARGRTLTFEIGTEEQSGLANTLVEIEAQLTGIQDFCARESLPPPSFMVMQTGTKVAETRNVGSLDAPFRVAGEIPAEIQLPRLLNLCRKHHIAMKEHNADYLSDEVLTWHPKLGIHAANVAPEFGVAETRAFIDALRSSSRRDLLDRFLGLAFGSRKWEKWLVPGTAATDYDRAVIAGHYVFGEPEFMAIKNEAKTAASAMGIELDRFLKLRIKESISRYLRCFNLVENR